MSEPKQRVTAERACMEMNRIEELLATTKLNDMMHKKDDDQKTTVLWILAIIGAVAAVAAIAYAVYCFFTPDYLEDFDPWPTSGSASYSHKNAILGPDFPESYRPMKPVGSR